MNSAGQQNQQPQQNATKAQVVTTAPMPMTNPGMMQPGMMHTGMMQPGMMHPGMMQPGMMHPGMMPVAMAPGSGMGGMPMMVPMMMPAPIPSQIPMGTPVGLEFLLLTNAIFIKQQVELLEMFTGINTNNRYQILDQQGRRLYFAAEHSDFCSIFCLGSSRGWEISLFNAFGQVVLEGKRDCSCCLACGNNATVFQPGGAVLGNIVQITNCCTAQWQITNAQNQPLFLLEAPCCSVCCPKPATCCEAEFPLTTIEGNQPIGRISKYFGGILKEAYTEADTFGVEFPVDLDVSMKAVLIFATFLIDFVFYEDTTNGKHQNFF